MFMTPSGTHAPVPDEIARRAAEVLAQHPARVQRLEVAGQFYWVKAEERLTLRMRVQKGSASRAFEAERTAARSLAAAGAPVPPVVAEGPDFFVTPDSGRPLAALLRDPAFAPGTRLPAFAAAAEGLAQFHRGGLSHGRPSIRDICWDGSRATFIDFERYAARRNTVAGHAQDLMILIFSSFAATGRPCAETDMLIETYRRADPGGIWQAAERLAHRLRWTGPLSWPIRRFTSAREFRAIPLTLSAFHAA